MSGTRTEHDSFGDIEVPAHRLWGAQTQRSLEHFDISGERLPRELLLALAHVKAAADQGNLSLGIHLLSRPGQGDPNEANRRFERGAARAGNATAAKATESRKPSWSVATSGARPAMRLVGRKCRS